MTQQKENAEQFLIFIRKSREVKYRTYCGIVASADVMPNDHVRSSENRLIVAVNFRL